MTDGARSGPRQPNPGPVQSHIDAPEDDTMRGVSAVDLASKPNTDGGTAGTAWPLPPPSGGKLCRVHSQSVVSRTFGLHVMLVFE